MRIKEQLFFDPGCPWEPKVGPKVRPGKPKVGPKVGPGIQNWVELDFEFQRVELNVGVQKIE